MNSNYRPILLFPLILIILGGNYQFYQIQFPAHIQDIINRIQNNLHHVSHLLILQQKQYNVEDKQFDGYGMRIENNPHTYPSVCNKASVTRPTSILLHAMITVLKVNKSHCHKISMNDLLTLKRLGHCVSECVLFFYAVHHKCNISIWNWSNKMNI